jgi:hypothetical protein
MFALDRAVRRGGTTVIDPDVTLRCGTSSRLGASLWPPGLGPRPDGSGRRWLVDGAHRRPNPARTSSRQAMCGPRAVRPGRTTLVRQPGGSSSFDAFFLSRADRLRALQPDGGRRSRLVPSTTQQGDDTGRGPAASPSGRQGVRRLLAGAALLVSISTRADGTEVVWTFACRPITHPLGGGTKGPWHGGRRGCSSPTLPPAGARRRTWPGPDAFRPEGNGAARGAPPVLRVWSRPATFGVLQQTPRPPPDATGRHPASAGQVEQVQEIYFFIDAERARRRPAPGAARRRERSRKEPAHCPAHHRTRTTTTRSCGRKRVDRDRGYVAPARPRVGQTVTLRVVPTGWTGTPDASARWVVCRRRGQRAREPRA